MVALRGSRGKFIAGSPGQCQLTTARRRGDVRAVSATGVSMSRPRVIKRYANRKLYDTARSRYVTLEDLGELIKDGEDIRIIDNTTKEDLTAVTMAQILVEEEKRQKRSRPLPNLRDLIQQSGELLQKRIGEPVHNIRSSVEETRDHIRTWIEQNTRAIEDVQRRLDERIRLFVGGMDVIGRLQRQVDVLQARVETLEARLGIEPGGAVPDDEALIRTPAPD